jgi:hypothetical protein
MVKLKLNLKTVAEANENSIFRNNAIRFINYMRKILHDFENHITSVVFPPCGTEAQKLCGIFP